MFACCFRSLLICLWQENRESFTPVVALHLAYNCTQARDPMSFFLSPFRADGLRKICWSNGEYHGNTLDRSYRKSKDKIPVAGMTTDAYCVGFIQIPSSAKQPRCSSTCTWTDRRERHPGLARNQSPSGPRDLDLLPVSPALLCTLVVPRGGGRDLPLTSGLGGWLSGTNNGISPGYVIWKPSHVRSVWRV